MIAAALIAGVVGCTSFTGCVVGGAGGGPDLPPSSGSGTVRLFEATVDQTLTAITNAFSGHQYRNMILYPAASSGADFSSNRLAYCFTLEPTLSVDGAITTIPVRGARSTTLPYVAYFSICCAATGNDHSKVTVRTTRSEVIDGKEPGLHGGWANHYRKVPPVQREEDNVLGAIGAALDARESGQSKNRINP